MAVFALKTFVPEICSFGRHDGCEDHLGLGMRKFCELHTRAKNKHASLEPPCIAKLFNKRGGIEKRDYKKKPINPDGLILSFKSLPLI
ncbi:hypothetical protein [Pedobacter endophyticus]|uniref:Uncharacterized protein n=1 Tax=Pedobacter endophyticus TaxID=2789740 RepID=A0A7S9Q053_9SPHI|nr:hypothetical protein [Pedobacter endophyticus]QPH41298.1 hypothetical protein IZT61_08600 [Pedobacter endophyticus]